MSSFQLPKETALDTTGVAISGGKLYTYVTGTSTPATTYQNRSAAGTLTTAHANPIIADAAGRFGTIYGDPDVVYKLVFKDAAENTIYTVDPVYPMALAGGDITERLLQIASSPLDYGGAGNGSTNDAAALQAAISGATGTIDLLGKTYRCDSSLTIGSGKRLVNGTIDFSNASATELITCAGTIGSVVNLSVDAAIGAITLTLTSTAGLAAGDYLHLSSANPYATDIADGEIVRIKSVDSATVVTLTSKVYWSYATGDTANVKKLTVVKNTSIEDIRIVAATASTQRAFVVQYGQNIHIKNVTVDGVYTAGIQFDTCQDFSIAGAVITDMGDATNGTGIEVVGACNNWKIENANVDNCSYGIKTGNGTRGVVRNGTISSCRVVGADEVAVAFGIDTYAVRVADCEITGGESAIGVYCLGGNCWVERNRFRSIGTLLGATIYANPGREASYTEDDLSVDICGNHIFNETNVQGIGVVLTAGVQLKGISICDNFLGGGSLNGIEITGDSVDGVVISGNRLVGAGIGVSIGGAEICVISNNVIEGSGINSGVATGSVVISGNSVINSSDGITVSAQTATISGNLIRDCGDDGIVFTSPVTTCTGVTISGNTIYGPGGEGIHVFVDDDQDIRGLNITGNSITDAASASILVEGSDPTPAQAADIFNFTISGNQISDSVGPGINLAATLSSIISNGVISGNFIKIANDTAANILISGGGEIRDLAIFGNHFMDGDYAVERTVTSSSRIAVGANYGNSLATAFSTGTILYDATSTAEADLPSFTS